MYDHLFESERVKLRALAADNDLPLFHEWWTDADTMFLQSSNAINQTPPGTHDDLFRGWFQPEPGKAAFVIALKATDESIGMVTLWGATPKDQAAMLAILISRPYWSQGYGREALRLTLHYGFMEMNLHRIGLTVFAYNERAIRAYQAVGFVEEGRRREIFFRDGQWQDDVLMSILQREYLAGLGDGRVG